MRCCILPYTQDVLHQRLFGQFFLKYHVHVNLHGKNRGTTRGEIFEVSIISIVSLSYSSCWRKETVPLGFFPNMWKKRKEPKSIHLFSPPLPPLLSRPKIPVHFCNI
ncbi:hypothetical protein POVWA1_015030 [Plasmodium ovale wallikeri]|uniref:Uncharacterized protein n=1 Tax=Plasmodium ovale wallikeri TaxID=864142 RepID=A0A1A8YNP4_PLAOA|nr:hypothetical protein POVWA1_015030 [Plasmodium ovale wallikeri]